MKNQQYKFTLKGHGNPDFMQFAPVAPDYEGAGTLTQIRDKAREYIRFWNLGGGNFECIIHNAPIHLSYNGRFWTGKGNFNKNFKNWKEIIIT